MKNWNLFLSGICVFALSVQSFAQDGILEALPPTQAAPQENQIQDPGPLTTPDLPQVPQQIVIVPEERAGWQAANYGEGERLSENLRANWVMVDANGLLRGTVIGFGGAEVGQVNVFLMQNGRVVNSTWVNEQGQFTFNNVQQGTFGLIGFGSESFFAFGFNAIKNSDNPEAKAPTSITVMASPNQTAINTDWIAFFSPKVEYRVYGRFESREGSDDPSALYGTDGISTHYPEGYPSTSIQSHAVTAAADGRLLGRVHQIDSLNGRPVDVRNTRVMLLQNNDVFAATSSDNFGVFEFADIPAGNYSLVAAGDDGVGAIGIEVVDAQNAEGEVIPLDIALLPSETTGWLANYSDEAAYQRALAVSAKLHAKKCNCPPYNPYTPAIMEALRGSKRGEFWRKLNDYFDQLFYGQGSSNSGYQQYPQQYYQQPMNYNQLNAPQQAPTPMPVAPVIQTTNRNNFNNTVAPYQRRPSTR